MTRELASTSRPGLPAQIADRLPPMIAADERAAWRFVDFFAETIRNPNTRDAYHRAVCRFIDWCQQNGLYRLGDVMPIHIAAYVEQLPLSRASVKQHMAAISRYCDWLVSGGQPQMRYSTI